MTHRWDFVRSSHDIVQTTPALKNPSNASSIRTHPSSTHSNQHQTFLPSAQRRTCEWPSTEETATAAAVGFTSQSLTFTETTNQSKRGGGGGGRAVNSSSTSSSSSSSMARRQRGERLALEFAADDFHQSKSPDHTRFIVNYDTFSGCDNKSGEAAATTITTNNDGNHPPSPHSPHNYGIDIDLNLDHLIVDTRRNNQDEDEEQFSSDNRSTNLASSDTCGGGIISYNSYKQRLHDRQPSNESDLHATFGHKLDKNQPQQPSNDIPKRICHLKTPSHGDLSSIDHKRATHPSDHVIRRQCSQGSKDSVTQISLPKTSNSMLEEAANSIIEKDAEIKRLQDTVNILEEELRTAEISLLKHQASSWSQRSRSGSPGSGAGRPIKQHNQQRDNCQLIDVIRADNEQLTQKINRISESSAQTKLLLESEINKLAQENHKLRSKASISSSGDISARKLTEMSGQLTSLTTQMKEVSEENTRLLSEVRVLEERTKELVNQNNQLATVNEVQFEDIQRLAACKVALVGEIQQVNLRKDSLEETSRQTEQLRFNLTKEFEEKFNMRVQEIYYKMHKQIDQYKQQLLLLKNAAQVHLPIDTRREYHHSSSSNLSRLPSAHTQTQGGKLFHIKALSIDNNTQMLSPQHMLPPDDTGRSRQFSGKDRNDSNERGDSKEKTTMNTHRQIPPLVMKEKSQIHSTHLRSEEVENIGSRTRRSTCHSNSKSRSSTIVSTTANAATTADIERRVAWEICGILRSDSLESLPSIVAKLKDSQKQLQKFADCIIEMVVTCNPQRSFEETTQLLPETHRDTGRMRTQTISSMTQYLPPSHQQPSPPPSLKQSWKWLKQIIEEFMQLKTILPSLQEFENNACALLNASNRQEAKRFIQEKVSECATANRIFKKVSDIFRIPPCKNHLDLENALNRIHAQQSQPPRHSAPAAV